MLLGAPNAGRADPSDAAGVVWGCDFEGTYCGMEEQSKVEPEHRSTFVPIARSGKQAIKLTTLPGDDNVHSSRDWERDDLELAPSPRYCNEGQEEWWAVSILFPDDYVVPKGLGAVLDFHTNASSGAPNFNLMSTPGGLRLTGYYGDKKNPTEYKSELGRVHRNKWYDFVLHVRWTSQEDGLMAVWVNGDRVLSHRGPTLYAGLSCYLKLANYHDAAGSPSSIIFDRLLLGTSERAVALTDLWH